MAQLHPLLSSWLGTFTASRVGHECVFAADNSVSASACCMSVVLHKTLPTESGLERFFDNSVFKEINESLNRIPFNGRFTGHCRVLSYAFSRKAGAMLFLSSLSGRLVSQNTVKCEGSRQRQQPCLEHTCSEHQSCALLRLLALTPSPPFHR